uniref:Uncharacterized protein n=1 Tax=Salix viminalis TaxID=40686 RepID=A0A6N2L744_SALVM
MEFDEYDCLEKTIENPELPKVKETANELWQFNTRSQLCPHNSIIQSSFSHICCKSNPKREAPLKMQMEAKEELDS